MSTIPSCKLLSALLLSAHSQLELDSEDLHLNINICLQLTVRKALDLIGGFPLPGPTWHSYLASSFFVAFTTWRLNLPSESLPRTKYRSKPGKCRSNPVERGNVINLEFEYPFHFYLALVHLLSIVLGQFDFQLDIEVLRRHLQSPLYLLELQENVAFDIPLNLKNKNKRSGLPVLYNF